MRRLLVLAMALGLFLAVPTVTASAQEQLKAAIHIMETSEGVNPDGTSYAEGVFRVFIGGVLVEEGTTTAFFQVSEEGALVDGYRTYVDASTGNEVFVDLRARLVKISGDETTFTYRGWEDIVSSTAGLTGQATVRTTVVGAEDGSYTLNSLGKWNITVPAE